MIGRLVRQARYAAAFIDAGTLMEWAATMMKLPTQAELDVMIAESFEFWLIPETLDSGVDSACEGE